MSKQIGLLKKAALTILVFPANYWLVQWLGQLRNSPTTRHWSQYADLDLATFSSTTSRQTVARSSPSEFDSAESPTRNTIWRVMSCGNSDDGGGSSAYFETNAFTLFRNGPSTGDSPDGKVKKSFTSAVTRRFIRFNGRPFTTILFSNSIVRSLRVSTLRRRVGHYLSHTSSDLVKSITLRWRNRKNKKTNRRRKERGSERGGNRD